MSYSYLSINKNKELNFVCILRNNNYDPKNIKILIEKIVKQNPNLEKSEQDFKSWPLLQHLK